MGMAPIWGIRSLSFILSCVAQATGAAGKACAQVADDVAQATAGAAGAVGQVSAQVADDVAQATGAAGAAGQAGGKVSREVLVGVNVAFLMFDALDLGYTIRDILKNKGSEAAKHLREKANKLEATMKQ